MSRIAVVIPCFNSEPYLGSALESLSRQTFADFEVVVVDDGSSDGSVAICGRWFRRGALRGDLLERPAGCPKGVASCRNLGVASTGAEWIAFLDSDDEFHPEKLARVDVAISSDPEGFGALYHRAEQFEDGTGKPLRVAGSGQEGPARDLLPVLLDRNVVITSTVVVKRSEFLAVGGFDLALSGAEDYWMWLRLARRTRWKFLEEPLSRYRLRADSLMSGRPFTHYVEQACALLHAMDSSTEFPAEAPAALRDYVLGEWIEYYASRCLRERGVGDVLTGALRLASAGHVTAAGRIVASAVSGAARQKGRRLRELSSRRAENLPGG